MSGITFLSENLFNLGVLTVTTGTENAQFPLSNLQQDTTTKKFRSVGNTVVIEVDLLQIREIDTIALVGDATTNLGVTAVTVKTAVTNDFTGATPIPITLSEAHNIGYEFITPVNHRYVEITLTGTGAYAELSNVFIGKKINLANNAFATASFKYGYDDQSQSRENRYGQRFIHVLPLVKRLIGRIEYCDKTEQEILDDMFSYHGRHKPIWVIIDPAGDAMNAGEFKLAMYSYILKQPLWSAVGGQHYNVSLELDQAV